jgi:hypothetical protein
MSYNGKTRKHTIRRVSKAGGVATETVYTMLPAGAGEINPIGYTVVFTTPSQLAAATPAAYAAELDAFLPKCGLSAAQVALLKSTAEGENASCLTQGDNRVFGGDYIVYYDLSTKDNGLSYGLELATNMATQRLLEAITVNVFMDSEDEFGSVYGMELIETLASGSNRHSNFATYNVYGTTSPSIVFNTAYPAAGATVNGKNKVDGKDVYYTLKFQRGIYF